MKKGVKNLFIASVLIVGHLTLVNRVTAQIFTNLDTFEGYSYAGLILSDNVLYGTAASGGSYGSGFIFAININGTGFTNLHSFTAVTGSNPYYNSDGAGPQAALILSGHILYGTTVTGGSSGRGTVFALNTNGTGFTNLHTFTFNDGITPFGGLTFFSNTLYGATSAGGGTSDNGTVFAVKTDGTGFTKIHSFAGGTNDGAVPASGNLVLSENTLYGTTQIGGALGNGIVFALSITGTTFRILHSFDGTNGAFGQGSLSLSQKTLFGTTCSGGTHRMGTVFRVNTDGTGFTNLHNFTGGMDGAEPYGGVIISSDILFGTGRYGGADSLGLVFAINTDGTGLRVLHSFEEKDGGSIPFSSLLLFQNALYGTTQNSVFRVFIQPQLTIIPSGQRVILTWPTSYNGFTLQSTTNLGSPVWTTNSLTPVVVNGQNTVTNPISLNHQFFRLSQ